MRIGIIGTGSMGTGFARALAAKHEVWMGSRDADRGKEAAVRTGAVGGGSYEEVARDADVILFTVPWMAAESVATQLGDVSGKVVLDVTNPYTAEGLQPLEGTSTGEEVQRWLPGAKVVKGFNHVFSSNLGRPEVDGTPVSVLIAGDDEDAKRTVSQLAADMGFDPVDVGGLETTRHLERLLGLVGELGDDRLLKVLHR